MMSYRLFCNRLMRFCINCGICLDFSVHHRIWWMVVLLLPLRIKWILHTVLRIWNVMHVWNWLGRDILHRMMGDLHRNRLPIDNNLPVWCMWWVFNINRWALHFLYCFLHLVLWRWDIMQMWVFIVNGRLMLQSLNSIVFWDRIYYGILLLLERILF